jgi:hypothetical protein
MGPHVDRGELLRVDLPGSEKFKSLRGCGAVDAKSSDATRETLERHGATDEEIEFLCPEVGDCQRIELNAMTSRQLVDFIETKLEQNGVEKLVPDEETLIEHAKRLKEQAIAQRVLERLAGYDQAQGRRRHGRPA